MVGGPQGPDGSGKGIYADARPAERATPRAALGQDREDLCLRQSSRPKNPRRPVRRAKSARGAAFHVRARLGGGLQKLLVLGRPIRPDYSASEGARHHAGGGFARALAQARTLQKTNGLELRLVLFGQYRLQSGLCRLVYTARTQFGRKDLQLQNLRLPRGGSAGDQRLLSRREWRHLSYLFVLRARPRHDERGLSISRSHAARTSRGRRPSDGMG